MGASFLIKTIIIVPLVLVAYEMIIANLTYPMYTRGIVEDFFITQHTYLRIEVFDGVAKQLMKNVNSTRTWALITSQGVSRFKNLKRTKPIRVGIRITMTQNKFSY